jgi:hypothetical protein
MAAGKRKSWREKVASAKAAEVKPCPRDIAGMKTGQKMLVPSGASIEEGLRQLPAGARLSAPAFRAGLARAHGADVACPITTGILMRLVAEAAYEDYQAGAPLEALAPFWRAAREGDGWTKKFSGGFDFIRERQDAER